MAARPGNRQVLRANVAALRLPTSPSGGPGRGGFSQETDRGAVLTDHLKARGCAHRATPARHQATRRPDCTGRLSSCRNSAATTPPLPAPDGGPPCQAAPGPGIRRVGIRGPHRPETVRCVRNADQRPSVSEAGGDVRPESERSTPTYRDNACRNGTAGRAVAGRGSGKRQESQGCQASGASWPRPTGRGSGRRRPGEYCSRGGRHRTRGDSGLSADDPRSGP